jgi:hypothetical protein
MTHHSTLKCQDESLHLWKDKFESIRFLSAPGGESNRVGRERSATVHGDVLPTGALFDFLIYNLCFTPT